MQCLQQTYPEMKIFIYCGEGSHAKDLAAHSKERFNIQVEPTFVPLSLPNRDLLNPSNYPRLTMVRQAIASVRVACTALDELVPEIWIDTTGWAFPYPIIRSLGSRIVAYVHYPTISTDMLERVGKRQAAFNNSSSVASSSLASRIKLIYYQIFAFVYGLCGGFATIAMVNSSWTRGHISKLWWGHHEPALVYPPCDTTSFQALPLDRSLKKIIVASVAQFRPEKNHELQLRALAKTKAQAKLVTDSRLADVIMQLKFIFIGGCRGQEDAERVQKLKSMAQELGLDDSCVEFKLNAPFSDLQKTLGKAIAGIHSMENEHFGISVVEYMASGAIPIAHATAGPKQDIVVPEKILGQLQPTGYLCTTVDEYSRALIKVLSMSHTERLQMAEAGRIRSRRFSDQRFQTDFASAMGPVVQKLTSPGTNR